MNTVFNGFRDKTAIFDVGSLITVGSSDGTEISMDFLVAIENAILRREVIP